jgi:hypothetical protein
VFILLLVFTLAGVHPCWCSPLLVFTLAGQNVVHTWFSGDPDETSTAFSDPWMRVNSGS